MGLGKTTGLAPLALNTYAREFTFQSHMFCLLNTSPIVQWIYTIYSVPPPHPPPNSLIVDSMVALLSLPMTVPSGRLLLALHSYMPSELPSTLRMTRTPSPFTSNDSPVSRGVLALNQLYVGGGAPFAKQLMVNSSPLKATCVGGRSSAISASIAKVKEDEGGNWGGEGGDETRKGRGRRPIE